MIMISFKKQNKNISSIKAQIAALEGSTNASARAKLDSEKPSLMKLKKLQ